MKREIVHVDEKRGIFQITTLDERWYAIPDKTQTEPPTYKYLPSITWIAGHYPKGIAFYKWLAGKGWDEAESIKQAAGDKGSKVHHAIESLIVGNEIKMDDRFFNGTTKQEEELSVEEYQAILAFADWANTYKPEFLQSELTVVSEKHGFAGTVDCLAKIGEQLYIIDFKTGQYIWPEYEIQVSAYKQAMGEMNIAGIKDAKLAILQVGYRMNKRGYKFTEIEDKFDLFLHAKAIWENENPASKPKQRDYPVSISLTYNK